MKIVPQLTSGVFSLLHEQHLKNPVMWAHTGRALHTLGQYWRKRFMNNVALFCSIIDTAEFDSVQSPRRRRMEREAKAKVVASVWGAEFSQFLAALAVLPRLIWKKRLNSSPNKRDDLCRCFCLHPSSIPAAEKLNKCPVKKVFCNF